MNHYETITKLRKLGIVTPINKKGQIYLRKADLAGCNLGGAYLCTADLAKANLSQANLSRANLVYGHLSQATLSGTNLEEADLRGADLREACLSEAHLVGANLETANLFWADLRRAKLCWANLRGTDLRGADLRRADLGAADLSRADLRGANLRRADLRQANLYAASLTAANLEHANLRGCQIKRISARHLNLAGTHQENLIITQRDEPVIAVDSLEIAQLLDLLLDEHQERRLLNKIKANLVLILGHFMPGRKAILEALRQGLRQRNYLPVLVDSEETLNPKFMEKMSTLARLSRFVIADLTSPPALLEEIPPLIESIEVPIVPLLPEGAGQEPPMIRTLRQSHLCLLETCFYKDHADLLASLEKRVIVPAEAMAGTKFEPFGRRV